MRPGSMATRSPTRDTRPGRAARRVAGRPSTRARTPAFVGDDPMTTTTDTTTDPGDEPPDHAERARQLRAEADADDKNADEMVERSPSYAELLRKRARHKRE